jgi:5-methylcytosine-specific restriction protein B
MISSQVGESFGIRNQNCAIFLATDGKLYPHNKAKDTFALTDEVLAQLGPGVVADSLFWSIYGNETEATRGAVSQLEKLIGREKLSKIENMNTPLSLPTPNDSLAFNNSITNAILQSLDDAALIVDANLLHRFTASLMSKRFLVLTGLAGSGKTKIAHAFAHWMSELPEQYRLVAVGADWTSNENVLGYQDALQPAIYRKPASGALDLILRAEKDPERPYFLILDEMNLSHVERYFADILSAIESGQEIALHSAAEPLGAFEGDSQPVPATICLPENLFIIGTVNIDETTYMFSPKVLDRANVIEFRVSADEISSFLESPAKVNMDALAGKGAGYGSAFVNAAQSEVSLAQLPPGIGDGAASAAELKQRLTELFAELAPIGAEFGFRTAFEISRFFYHHAVLTGGGWQFKDALDAQIVQKLMPKLHGSDRKLRPTLTKLKSFCETHDLQLSLTKTNRMLERLTQDGFTSFAEA